MTEPTQTQDVGVWTVRASLFLAFGALILVTAGALLLLSFVGGRRLSEAQARRQIGQAQAHTREALENVFAPLERAARRAGLWIESGSIERYDEEALLRRFLPELEVLSQSCSVMVSDMSGYEFLLLRNLGPGGLLEAAPDEGAWITRDVRRDAWGDLSRWTLRDEAGAPRRRWERELDYDPRPRVWHAGARAARAAVGRSIVYWTRVDEFFTSRTPGITASLAAADPAGDIVVVGYDLLLSDLVAELEGIRPTPHGKVFVITDGGALVAPAAGQPLAPPARTTSPALASCVAAWEGAGRGTQAELRFEASGQAWWGGVAPVALGPGRRLWVGVALPEADLLADVRREQWRVLVIGGLAFVGAMLLAAFLARRYARPLAKLAERSRRVADLDLAPAPPVRSRLVEVRALSTTLEEQRAALADHIAERDRAEAARRESEAKYRRLVEHLPGPYFFYAHDSAGVFTYVSPSVERILGYTREEFCVHYSTYLTDDPVNEVARLATDGSLRGERQPPYEVALRAKDGSLRRLEVLEVPIVDDDGRVTGVEGIAYDLTSHKASEAALQQAVTRAEQGERAKTEFLANTSHELRTPLNAVLGLAQLLANTELDLEQREYVDTIEASGKTLLAVVNDLLDLSKVEAGRLEFERLPFAVAACVEGALDLVRPRAREQGLAVTARMAPGVPEWVEGDEVRVRQVLLNLLGNAVKFTAAGAVEVEVDATPGEGGRWALRFSVSDTGPGVAPALRETLFEPFTQADASMTRRYGGTGLGLAICRRLSEGMGGACWYEPRAEGGSIFRFTILTAAAQAPGSGSGRLPRAEVATGPPLRVLVTEDDRVSRRLAVRYLERIGHRVEEATTGVEALERLTNGDFDVVLMDVQMPEMDGLETTRRLRALLPRERQPRVLAMTANASPADRAACLAAGMDDFLAKPIDLRQLGAAVADAGVERQGA